MRIQSKNFEFMSAFWISLALCLFFTTRVDAGQESIASTNSICEDTALARSDRMIRVILDDVAANYLHIGGGGISEIREVATGAYRISLPQEERIDHLTYHLDVDAKCHVKVLRKEASTTSFDHKR